MKTIPGVNSGNPPSEEPSGKDFPGNGFTGAGLSEGTWRGWKILSQFPAGGGEADIFLVRQGETERILKLYRQGIKPDPKAIETITRVGICFPEHLVRILESGTDPESDRFFEIEEFLSGGTLGELIAGKPLEDKTIREILGQMGKILATLHEEGIVHSDLKPANLLIRQRDPLLVAVSDFGCSSLFDAALSKRFTQAKGTSLYQSPEASLGAVLPQSDWWSLGMIILECLLGRHPLAGLNNQVVMYQLATRGIEIPGNIDPGWRALLEGLLARNPESRWGRDEVKRWLRGENVPPPPPEENSREASRAEAPPSGRKLDFGVPDTPPSMGDRPRGADLQADEGGETSSPPPRQFGETLSLGGEPCGSPEEFLARAFHSPPTWDEAARLLESGGFREWMIRNGDPDRAALLETHVGSGAGSGPRSDPDPDPDTLLFRTGIFLVPTLPFCWLGRKVDEKHLLSLLETADSGKHGGPGERELKLVSGLFSGEPFRSFARFSKTGLGRMDPLFRCAQTLMGSPLRELPLEERSRLLFLAATGSATPSRVLETLERAFDGEERASKDCALLFQPGAAEFLSQSRAIEGDDRGLMAMCARIRENADKLHGTPVGGFFPRIREALPILRKDASLREVLARIFSRSNVEIALAEKIRSFLPQFPWLEELIRLIYRFPPDLSLEKGYSFLFLARTIDSRWAEWSRKYILPDYLIAYHGGKQVSSRALDTIQKIVQNPGLLTDADEAYPTWGELLASVPKPEGAHPESLELLGHLKRQSPIFREAALQERMIARRRKEPPPEGFPKLARFILAIPLMPAFGVEDAQLRVEVLGGLLEVIRFVIFLPLLPVAVIWGVLFRFLGINILVVWAVISLLAGIGGPNQRFFAEASLRRQCRERAAATNRAVQVYDRTHPGALGGLQPEDFQEGGRLVRLNVIAQPVRAAPPSILWRFQPGFPGCRYIREAEVADVACEFHDRQARQDPPGNQRALEASWLGTLLGTLLIFPMLISFGIFIIIMEWAPGFIGVYSLAFVLTALAIGINRWWREFRARP